MKIKLLYFFLVFNLVEALAQQIVLDDKLKGSILKQNNKPNIVLILADDMSFKTLVLDGGPSFLNTPGLNRIANEGIRFTQSFVTFSLCEPSRAQLLTGYYPHKTGVITGGQNYDIDTSYFTLPEIISANGYHTGFVGKYQLGYSAAPRQGWDYWFSFAGGIGNDANNGYFETACNLNGADTFISYHMSDAIANFTKEFLESDHNQRPFFLIISEAAPHKPYQPQITFDKLFKSTFMTLPDNFNSYYFNYPSYLYPEFAYIKDAIEFTEERRNYFELVHGMDTTIKVTFDYLDSKSITDSTLIIFTSDNGYSFGEHMLAGKRLAYEESIKVPLYIRYPNWFPQGGIIDSTHLALNLDLFSTVINAAGVIDTFNTHGISLQHLVSDSIKRNLFMYEYMPSPNLALPQIRSIRTSHYKYIKSYCDNFTEEFFDLKSDPNENYNQIFNPAFSNQINDLRSSLDSIMIVLDDTTMILNEPCFLVNEWHGVISADTVSINLDNILLIDQLPEYWFCFFAFQVPDQSFFSLYDVNGRLVNPRTAIDVDSRNILSIATAGLSQSIYYLRIEVNGKVRTLKLLKANPH